jgi:hypothetical protein
LVLCCCWCVCLVICRFSSIDGSCQLCDQSAIVSFNCYTNLWYWFWNHTPLWESDSLAWAVLWRISGWSRTVWFHLMRFRAPRAGGAWSTSNSKTTHRRQRRSVSPTMYQKRLSFLKTTTTNRQVEILRGTFVLFCFGDVGGEWSSGRNGDLGYTPCLH